MRAPCPLCSARKAKRLCPALGHEICPVCCATKRLTQIRCPSGCSYLSASRARPATIVQRQRDRDMRFLLPRIADLSEPQYRLFMLFQAVVLQHKAAIDEHLKSCGIPVSYTNVFWGGRSEIKPSEISPFAYRDWCRSVGLDAERMREET